MRFGMFSESGWYSLTLLLRVCILALVEASFSELLLDSSPEGFSVPERAFRLDWCAMAAAIDSPFLETSTDSGIVVGVGWTSSLEGGRPLRRFQGPGESPESSGEGSGVRSPMAVMTGLETLELVAEPKPRPKAADLKLGVRDTGFSPGGDDLRDKGKVVVGFDLSGPRWVDKAPWLMSALGKEAEWRSVCIRSGLVEPREGGWSSWC